MVHVGSAVNRQGVYTEALAGCGSDGTKETEDNAHCEMLICVMVTNEID